MYSMFVSRSGYDAPQVIVREATERVDVEGTTLLRDAVGGKLRPLLSFERLFDSREQAEAAGADEIEEIARQWLEIAGGIRARVAAAEAGSV